MRLASVRTITLALLLLLFLPLAHADEASKRAKIEQLFQAMHMEQTMSQMLDMGMAQGEAMSKSLTGDKATLTADDQKLLDEFHVRLKALVNETLSWAALEPSYVDLYAKNFTEEQIDAALVFYQSPAGSAFIEKLPQMLKQSQTIVLARAQDLGPKMQALIQEYANKVEQAHQGRKKSS